MADSYVCSGATMRCTMGTSQAKLTVLPVRTVYLAGQPQANISDHKSMVNLAPFGRCRSLGYPATASATAAHHGHLTPMPCIHNTPMPWMNGKNDDLIKGQPALLKSCTCQCMWGGTISLVTDGQVGEGTKYVQKKPLENHTQPSNNIISPPDNKTDDNIRIDNADLYDTGDSLQSGSTIPITSKAHQLVNSFSREEIRNWYNGLQKQEREILVRIVDHQMPETTSMEQRIGRVMQLAQDAPSSFSRQDKLLFAENSIQIENKLGVKKGRKMTISEADKQNANPKYTQEYVKDPYGNIEIDGVRFSKNPNFDKQYSINCATCAAAYVLRLRGFDVKAKGNTLFSKNRWLSKSHSFDIWNNPDGTKATPVTTQDWMKKNNIKAMTVDSYRKYFDETCKDEGVYVLTLTWSNESSGHATILQRDKDGNLYHIEPQVYNGDPPDGRRSIDNLLLDKNGKLALTPNPSPKKGIMRVDDKLFNPEYASLFDT